MFSNLEIIYFYTLCIKKNEANTRNQILMFFEKQNKNRNPKKKDLLIREAFNKKLYNLIFVFLFNKRMNL